MAWLTNLVLNYFVRNWSTSAAGIIGALCTQIPALAPFKDAIIAVTIALVGILAKSAGTTGTAQTDAAKTLVTPPAPVPLQPAP